MTCIPTSAHRSKRLYCGSAARTALMMAKVTAGKRKKEVMWQTRWSFQSPARRNCGTERGEGRGGGQLAKSAYEYSAARLTRLRSGRVSPEMKKIIATARYLMVYSERIAPPGRATFGKAHLSALKVSESVSGRGRGETQRENNDNPDAENEPL